MKRLSSNQTFFRKRVFPVVWFGGLTAIIISMLLSEPKAGQSHWPDMLIPLAFIVIGYFMMKFLVLDLADEVYDLGDSLLIRSRQQEVRVALSDIKHVACNNFTNPTRITLVLTKDCGLRSKVVFEPLTKYCGMFSMGEQIADDLRRRCQSCSVAEAASS